MTGDTTDRSPVAAAGGLLVLGMHRSGTSALARVLGLCGADLGTRLLEAGAGNETGHWEDAYAVELHERLLAAMAMRWDDPLALPSDWLQRDAGRALVRELGPYLRDRRAPHSPWVAKDPRLCLFAPAWAEAATKAGQSLSAVLVIRHPHEVAGSLAARDGIAMGRGLLLWLDYSLAALETAEAMPTVVVDYPSLLANWRAALSRVKTLPGMAALAAGPETGAAVDAFLDAGRRHHAAGEQPLPAQVARVWDVLQSCAARGNVPAGTAADLRRELQPVRELVQPLFDEWRQSRRLLWERVGHAEAALAHDARALPSALDEFARGIEATRKGLLDALGQEFAPRLTQLAEVIELNRQGLLDAVAVELRRMQDVVQQVQAGAAGNEAKARLADQLAPQMEGLLALTGQLRADLATTRAEHDKVRAERDQVQAEGDKARDAQRQATDQVIALQRELAGLRFEAECLRDTERQFNIVVGSRTWRWTRPLRLLARLLRGQLADSDRAKLGRLIGRPVPAAPASMASSALAASPALKLAAADGLPDVFVWAVIDWHFRFQRPQHLARALAEKGHRVFYISNNFEDASEPGFRIDPLDDAGRLFQVHLNLAGKPPIYFGLPSDEQQDALRASLAQLLAWNHCASAISLVQHPYWRPLARAVPSAKVVYDCMDHHGGFENNAPAVLEAEEQLVANADLVIVTSGWLEQEIRPKARAVAMVRNAGDFDFFSKAPKKVFRDERRRKVIGYFGAIAEWFDLDLVRAVAQAHPDALVLLVGNDTAGAGAALADLPNVRLTGEVPYADLPYWLHGFDVCLLPFKVIPLTLATNPVKVYEYLAAGKPVVSVDLPELSQFGGRVHVAGDRAQFIGHVGAALAAGSGAGADERQAFAAGQTWAHRAEAFDQALAGLEEPRASVVVLTYNNLAFTEACLFSLEAYSDYGNLEVIVVDNASSDGSREWLQAWADEPSAAGHTRRLILNDDNLGFSGGNNVGLRAATGEFLVLLNNDTYVTPGWLRGLCNHLRAEPGLGLVGPVTNNIGNEAKLDINYTDMTAMIREAGKHTRRHPGMRRALRTAAFFCVAMRRDVYERVGDMDEDFGVGFFEDDDYCRRVEQAGLAIACAEDVFVHHHLSASFDALKADRKRELFEANRAIYEKKWGPWTPHAYR